MSTTFVIRQGDTLPALRATLLDEDGVAVDLTPATSVRLHMRRASGGAAVLNAACTVTDAAHGVVAYVWQAGDTAIAGSYQAEFEVAWSSGGVQTFPNDGFLTVTITAQIA